MIKAFKKIKDLWSEHGFEIVLCLAILFLLGYLIYNKLTGKNGTWSKSSFILVPDSGGKLSSRYNDDTRAWNGNRGNDSKGEIECRRVLENYFGRSFNKKRPNFLRNPVTNGNFNLELDCYNAELGLAVEYNGRQHYEYVPFSHRNRDAFTNQKYRDELKRRMCKDNGVRLIEVPYTVKQDQIESYLHNELAKLGL